MLTNRCKVFLERSGARVINSEALRPPKPDCPVCGVMSSRLVIDPSRATLNHLVQDVLQSKLGYREFSINNEVGTLYDPDLEDNLEKKFSELGVKADSFLTIIDDDEENPHVNLSLSISEKSLPEDTEPISLPADIEVPRKQTGEPDHVQPNGNGILHALTASSKRKRAGSSLEEPGIEGRQPMKRGKVQDAPEPDDVVLVDGSGNGAIVIDD